MHLRMMSLNIVNDEDRSPSGSDTSNSSQEAETHTRVGTDFQAALEFPGKEKQDNEFKETLIWKPSDKISDSDIESYLSKAKSIYGYNTDQALAMLYWHEHNIENALLDMKTYVPAPDEWTSEEKLLFEQGFLYHGKNFTKIRTLLPDKSQSSLVNYYYSYKKTKLHKSLMENLQTKPDVDNNDDDDSVDYGAVNPTNICCNCDEMTNNLHSTPKGMLCELCFDYWKRTGVMRPESISFQSKIINTKNYNGDTTTYIQNTHNINIEAKSKENRNSFRRPPKGIYLNVEELHGLTQEDQDQIFDRLDNKIVALKKEMQANKQDISLLMTKYEDLDRLLNSNIVDLQQQVNTINGTNQILTPKSLWTQREAELAIQGLQKYDKDYNAISQLIETKSEESVKAFYEYHKQYSNLDDILRDSKVVNNSNEIKSKAKFLLNRSETATQDLQNDDTSNDDVICI